MPTENRSSNTEMVSVPRFSLEAARDCLVICQDQAFQSCECESCPQCGLMPDECTGTECSKTCQCTTCEHCMNKDSIDSLTTLLARPVPQPHPEPIAWMVGTAFWWTKEEAERDAAETGLQIVGLGPMTSIAPAQHQGEPVALPARKNPSAYPLPMDAARGYGWNACLDEIAKLSPLYTHADPGEVERLRAQLAERDALLHSLDCAWNSHDGKERFGKLMRKVETLAASAEPSVPAAQPGKCLDGGDCGIGGTCKWCPHTTASPAQQPS